MYFNPNIIPDTWLTEHCLICGTVNHIFIDTQDTQAWECYFCSNRFWLDELARDGYIIQEGVIEGEADVDLNHQFTNVKFAYGHYEREN